MKEIQVALGEKSYWIKIAAGLLAAAGEASVRKGGADWQNSARLQAEFIAAHPLDWIGDLARAAADHATAGFYAAVIGLVHGVLLWDRELLDEYLAAP